MSSPADLARLKGIVTVYERELGQAVANIQNLGKQDLTTVDPSMLVGFGLELVIRIVDLNGKILGAYREYVKSLEAALSG